MRLILASSSPRRQELLATLGLDFEVIKPDVDEAILPDEDPYDYVRRLSIIKAQAVAAQLATQIAAQMTEPVTILAADTIVLAADTIGVDEAGDLLGKPVDADDARQMLRRLRGKPHIVCTAFTLLRVGNSPAQITESLANSVSDSTPTPPRSIGEGLAPFLHRDGGRAGDGGQRRSPTAQITELVRTTVTMRDYSDAEIDAYIASGDPFDKAGSYAIQNTQFRPVTSIKGDYNNVVGLPLDAVRAALERLHLSEDS